MRSDDFFKELAPYSRMYDYDPSHYYDVTFTAPVHIIWRHLSFHSFNIITDAGTIVIGDNHIYAEVKYILTAQEYDKLNKFRSEWLVNQRESTDATKPADPAV